uniref:Uncharacterized protein n=1 Tax=Cannabis sativa TaxID=3483 RepID=A0A803PTJ5_CANSA
MAYAYSRAKSAAVKNLATTSMIQRYVDLAKKETKDMWNQLKAMRKELGKGGGAEEDVDVLETAALETTIENHEATTSTTPTDQNTEVPAVQTDDPAAPSNKIDPYRELGIPTI